MQFLDPISDNWKTVWDSKTRSYCSLALEVCFILNRFSLPFSSPLQQLEACLEICNCFGLRQILCKVLGTQLKTKQTAEFYVSLW